MDLRGYFCHWFHFGNDGQFHNYSILFEYSSKGLGVFLRSEASNRAYIPLEIPPEMGRVKGHSGILREHEKVRNLLIIKEFRTFWVTTGPEKWCRGTELNCPHGDFQSPALPTELPRLDRESNYANSPVLASFFSLFFRIFFEMSLIRGKRMRKISYWTGTMLLMITGVFGTS